MSLVVRRSFKFLLIAFTVVKLDWLPSTKQQCFYNVTPYFLVMKYAFHLAFFTCFKENMTQIGKRKILLGLETVPFINTKNIVVIALTGCSVLTTWYPGRVDKGKETTTPLMAT